MSRPLVEYRRIPDTRHKSDSLNLLAFDAFTQNGWQTDELLPQVLTGIHTFQKDDFIGLDGGGGAEEWVSYRFLRVKLDVKKRSS